MDDSAHSNKVLPVKDTDSDRPITAAAESAHVVCQDSGWEAGFHLATAVDNAFILGYALLVMSFLGWIAGSILFIVGGACALYCNIKLARLCIIDGVRYVRFRDISYAVLGTWAKWVTVVGQWINILFGNVGLFILGGQALKGIHDLYKLEDQNIKLSEWMIVTGAIAWLFTMLIPHLHNLRLWSIIACACTVVFVAIVLGISIHDGRDFQRYLIKIDDSMLPPGKTTRSYAVLGSTAGKSFDALGALATISFAYTTVITPEIQATVRDPPVREFMNSLIITYGVGAPVYLIMSLVGYWAYGNTVAPNLISNLSGPNWAKTIAYLGVFIQIIVSFQVYASPIFEAFDTWYGDARVWSAKNILYRFVYRTVFVAVLAFVAALLPFFGDFVALIGSLSVLPLAFTLTLAMYVKVNRARMNGFEIIFDISLAVIFGLLTIGCTAASLRYIIVDSQNYSVFANIAG